ncbi:hypothetical protein A0U40_14035 [[Bacillus] sp. KCTC 13219]|nr:hypothetical protein A0U40_14035 [[Bacillus] sp. KCTC 13219]
MNTVKIEGREITLTQDAYITGTNEAPYYEAAGIDSEGNSVIVKWEIKSYWLNPDGTLNGDLEDETEACDWNNPITIR